MPNLTVPVGADRAPIIELLLGPIEDEIEALRAAGESIPQPRLFPVMLDTGSEISLLSRWAAGDLGLDPGGEREVFGVGAAAETGIVYRVRLLFPAAPPVLLASNIRIVVVEDLSRFGVSMIMGRDLLKRCLLNYNGPEGCCTFAF